MRGHIRKQSPNSWGIYIYLGKQIDPKTGKRKNKYKTYTVRGTRKQAETKLTEILDKINKGIFIEPTKITVEEYFTYWLKEHVKPNLSQGTYVWYDFLARKYIIPHWGYAKLSSISAYHIQSPMNEIRRKSFYIADGLYRTMRAAFNRAIQWQFIYKNPMEGVSLSGKNEQKRKYRTLNPEETLRFLKIAKKNSRHYGIYLCALTTGLRRGEILGLRWMDVDMEKKIIYVRQSLRKSGYNPVFDIPKNRRTDKGVAITNILLKEFKLIKEQQDIEKNKAGQYYKDYDLVFAIPGGRPVDPDNLVQRDFKKMLQKAGLPAKEIRFHDLRHSVATLLRALGVDLETISEILRLSSITIAESTYVHPTVEMQRASIEKLEGLLEGVK